MYIMPKSLKKDITRKVSNKKKLSTKRAKTSTRSKKASAKSIARAFVEMTGGNPFIVKYNNLQLGGKKKKSKKGSKKKGKRSKKKKGSKKK